MRNLILCGYQSVGIAFWKLSNAEYGAMTSSTVVSWGFHFMQGDYQRLNSARELLESRQKLSLQGVTAFD
jgi:hypothetical protein